MRPLRTGSLDIWIAVSEVVSVSGTSGPAGDRDVCDGPSPEEIKLAHVGDFHLNEAQRRPRWMSGWTWRWGRGGAWKIRWLRSPELFQLLLSPMTLIGRTMEENIGVCEKRKSREWTVSKINVGTYSCSYNVLISRRPGLGNKKRASGMFSPKDETETNSETGG